MERYEKGGYITEETFTSVTLRRNVGAPVKNYAGHYKLLIL